MLGPQLNLPGGLLSESGLERSVSLKLITGYIEQGLLEISALKNSSPEYVSKVLSTVVEQIGEVRPEPEDIDSLCVADRQYLMIQLSRMLEGDLLWWSHQCTSCTSVFDVPIDRSVLPVKKAGPSFPRAFLHLRNKALEFRVPSGKSQVMISNLDEEEALRVLVSSCLISVDGEQGKDDFLCDMTREEVAAIESALEESSPEVAVAVTAGCPECRQQQLIPFDPYSISRRNSTALYREIHALALYYHWSEAEILTLPRERRQLYLDLIDQARGMRGATAA
jgi:hypothetical protein